MSNFVVGNSGIHGRGLFAGKDYAKGEVILDLSSCSQMISRGEYERLSLSERVFVSEVSDGKFR